MSRVVWANGFIVCPPGQGREIRRNAGQRKDVARPLHGYQAIGVGVLALVS